MSIAEARRSAPPGERAHLALYPLLFAGVSFALAPNLFLAPRFWAEEGSVFFTQLRGGGLLHALTFVFNSNYLLATNLFTYLATLVPLPAAPAVTTYLSFAVELVVAYQIALFCEENGVPRPVTGLAVVLWAASPTNIEIFMTATNVQWVMGISVMMLAFLSLEGTGRGSLALMAAWALFCGLSGVPSCIAAPLLLLRGLLSRSPRHLVLGSVLAFCAIVQLSVIVHNPVTDRAFLHWPRILLLPTLIQTVYLPLVGKGHADELGRLALASRVGALLVAVPALAIMGFISAAIAFGTRKRRTLLIVLVAWLSISAVQLLGSLGPPGQVLAAFSALQNGRYLAAGQLAVVLALCLSATTVIRPLTVALLLLCLWNGVATSYKMERAFKQSLTPWRRALAACSARPCAVPIWPNGWTVTLAAPP